MGPLSEGHLPPQLFKVHQVYFHHLLHCGITELWIGGALGDSLSTPSVRKWGTSLWFTTKSVAPEAIFLESQFKLLSTLLPLDSQRRLKTLPRIAESNFVLVDPSVQSACCPFLPASSPWANNQLSFEPMLPGSSRRAGSWCHSQYTTQHTGRMRCMLSRQLSVNE